LYFEAYFGYINRLNEIREYFSEQEVRFAIGMETFDNEFAGNKDFFEGINRINENDIVFPKLNATLRDYQKYGYKWLKYLIDNNL